MKGALTFSQMMNFKLKEFADNNFKFDENGRKLSIQVETLWEKEKLLVMNNFSFSHSVFKRLVSQGRQKVSMYGNGLRVNLLPKYPML